MSQTNHPNILLIVSDQHRFDCLGPYGNRDIETPHLDALAQDAVTFDQSFVPCPVCAPSRYSLLTGRYVHQHLGWDGHCTLPSGISTFPSLLKNSGYRTQAVGKMHLVPTYLDVGYERMQLAEQLGQGRFDDDYHRYLLQHGMADAIDMLDQPDFDRHDAPPAYWETFGALPSDLPEEHHSTTWIADRADEVLKTWGPEGNLLTVSFIKPHHPFDPPAPWCDRYDPDTLSLLPGWTERCPHDDVAYRETHFSYEGMTEAQYRQVLAYYYATISQIDHQIGRLVETLKRNGNYENTLIVYTSDHGDYMGHHHMLLKGNYMYDPIVRVPLIIKRPGNAEADTRNDALNNNVDLTATILDAAGVEADPAMEGQSLFSSEHPRDEVFAECLWFSMEYMVRSRRYKLLVCEDAAQSRFFDLEEDPFELNNLIASPQHQERIAAMRERLMHWALFDSPSRVHLDPQAPSVPSQGVPTDPKDLRRQRNEAESYFRHKAAELSRSLNAAVAVNPPTKTASGTPQPHAAIPRTMPTYARGGSTSSTGST
ncbi:MAG: sulfatase-like hydrolase/transferase [Planctomycetota bacterium]